MHLLDNPLGELLPQAVLGLPMRIIYLEGLTCRYGQ